MKQARIKLLQSMPVFGGVSKEALEFLIDHASIQHLSPGEYFFREGDSAVSMFVLEYGTVAVSKQWDGENHLLKQFSHGDCFGEMALLDLFPRSASVMAVETCSAIELNHATLLKLYQYDLEQFTIIQMNIGREISRRLRIADNQLFESRFG
jgi:CRP-like cAMP-binding protein